MSWTAVSRAEGYSWILYQSATNAYVGSSFATGTTISATTATRTSLALGQYYYFTVAATGFSASSSAAASAIVQYVPHPYNITLSISSTAATLGWSAIGTNPTFYYTLIQTTVNAYTSGTQTTIVTNNTTSTSATYTFTPVFNTYYFFTIYQTTTQYGQSPTYQSPIFNYFYPPSASATPLALWLRGNSGLNTSSGTWTDTNSSTSYNISGTATTVTVNGLNACQFSSSSGYIASSITWSGVGRTVHVVMQLPAYVSGNFYIFSGPFASNNNTFDFRYTSKPSNTAVIQVTYQGNGSITESSTFSQLINVPVLYSVVVGASSTTYYVNGTSLGTHGGSIWSAGTSQININSFSTNVNANNNIFCEVVVHNGTLNSTDMTNSMNYLRNKWGTS